MIIDQITEKARTLTKKQQEDVLRYIQSDTRDISAGGAFVNTNAVLEPDSAARVVFSIPGQDKPFKLHSKVVRTEEEGVAFQFNKKANYYRQILAKVLSGSSEGNWLSDNSLNIEVG